MVGGNPEDFREYLVGIGMGSAQIEQVEEALATVRGILPEEPQFMIVTEYRDGEGNRNYESLWVFTEHFISEVSPFAGQGKVDLIRRDTGLSYLAVEYTDFDFQAPVEASRLRIDATFNRFGSALSAELATSGSNCADLNQVLREYVLPTIVEAGE